MTLRRNAGCLHTESKTFCFIILTSNESITNDTAWRQTCGVFFLFLLHAIKENSSYLKDCFGLNFHFVYGSTQYKNVSKGMRVFILSLHIDPATPLSVQSQKPNLEVSPLNEWKVNLLLLCLL